MKKIVILSIIFFSGLVNIQAGKPIPVTGKVSDTMGNPIPRVTVTVQENGNFTTTDQSGVFNIHANTTDHLVFSHPGFQEKTVAVKGRNHLNLTLSPATIEIVDYETELDECIAIGHVSQKKSAITGAVCRYACRRADIWFCF